jgi:hypothetical protein
MSYDIFKQNMLVFMRNQPNIAFKEQFAKKLVQEYDALIKRGFDTVNGITLQEGNTAAMEQVLNGVLNTAFQQSSGEHAIITNMGKAFQAYWTPISGGGSLLQQIIEFFTEEEKEEAEAIRRDIEIEYPKTKRIYESFFTTPSEALSHNKNVDREQVFSNQREIKESNSEQPSSGTGDETPSKTGPITTKGTGTDFKLLEKCGNGYWPAKGSGPGSFEESSRQVTKEGVRIWYKQNPDFIKANCTQVLLPTASGDAKLTIHKDLAAVAEPAFKIIREKKLEKFIANTAGGLAVRNVTGGTRLSNHSWGTAFDMNAGRYPFGTSFKSDGIYVGRIKTRDLNDFDKGFLQVAKVFQSVGMTWLSSNDPMHVSIYE